MSASTTCFVCSRAAVAPHCPGSKHCGRSSTGATSSCRRRKRRCCVASRCSRGGGHSKQPRGWAALDLLTSLVEKSLVLYEERGGEERYRLLETVRQYARDRLVEVGEAAAVRDRHRDWYLELAEQAYLGLRGARQREWLDRLE